MCGTRGDLPYCESFGRRHIITTDGDMMRGLVDAICEVWVDDVEVNGALSKSCLVE